MFAQMAFAQQVFKQGKLDYKVIALLRLCVCISVKEHDVDATWINNLI